MFAKHGSLFNLLMLTSVLLFTSVIVGCSGKEVESGTERTSSSTPVYYDRQESIPLSESDDRFQTLEFIHDQAVVVCRLSPAKIRATEILTDEQWAPLENWLGELGGNELAEMKQIEHCWFVLSETSSRPGDPATANSPPPAPPLLVVIDFVNGRQPGEVAEAIRDVEAVRDWQIESISDRRFVLGAAEQMEKFRQRKGVNVELAQQVEAWPEQSDFIGNLQLEAFSDQLRRAFNGAIPPSAPGNSNSEMERLADLPDSMKQLQWSVSLTDSSLVKIQIELEDEDLALKLGETAAKAISENRAMLSILPMALGQLGLKKSSQPIQAALEEVLNEDLLKAEANGTTVTLSCLRPSNFKEVLQAIMEDVRAAQTRASGNTD